MKKFLPLFLFLLIASPAFSADEVEEDGTYLGSFTTTNFKGVDVTANADTADVDFGDITKDVVFSGTTPTLTVGDAGAEDAQVNFDGNAVDYHVGLDDSADELVLGVGTALGTTPAIRIESDQDVIVSQDMQITGNATLSTLVSAGASTAVYALYADANGTVYRRSTAGV